MKYVTFSKGQVLKVLTEAGVPESLHEEAWQSVKEGYDVANSFKCLFSNLSAPLVVPFALLFTKWESEALPKQFDWYNNDTNLNGDRNLPVSLLKNDAQAIADCYYNEGHHPREYGSRYTWVGLRNRGKKSYMVKTVDDSLDQQEQIWGVDGVTRGDKYKEPVTGWTVVKLGRYWQIIGCLETGFRGYFQQPKWGWKTGLSQNLHRVYNTGEAMAVGFNLKLRKRKD